MKSFNASKTKTKMKSFKTTEDKLKKQPIFKIYISLNSNQKNKYVQKFQMRFWKAKNMLLNFLLN